MSAFDPTVARMAHLEKGKKRKPFLILDFALRRALLLLIVGSLLCVLVLSILVPKIQPVFEADGILLVDPTKEPTLTGRDRDPIPGAFPEDITTHVMTYADGLLLVARYKHSYFADLRKAIDLATQSGVSAITAILNFSEVPETPWILSAIQKSVVSISNRMAQFKSRLFKSRRGS